MFLSHRMSQRAEQKSSEEPPEFLPHLEPGQYHNPFILKRLLQSIGIINERGTFHSTKIPKEKLTEIQEAFFRFCNERINKYIETPRQWTVPKIGWKITFSLKEHLLYLKEQVADLFFEISEEQLLSLIDMEGVEFFFQLLSINLKEVLGEYEYNLLKMELNHAPICINIQVYTSSPSKKLTSQLHFHGLQFFSKKFPLPIRDFSTPYRPSLNQDQEVIKAIKVLHELKNSEFANWLTPDFVNDNNLLPKSSPMSLSKKLPLPRKALKKT